MNRILRRVKYYNNNTTLSYKSSDQNFASKRVLYIAVKCDYGVAYTASSLTEIYTSTFTLNVSRNY